MQCAHPSLTVAARSDLLGRDRKGAVGDSRKTAFFSRCLCACKAHLEFPTVRGLYRTASGRERTPTEEAAASPLS